MNFDFQTMLYRLPAIAIGFTFHEFMHAKAAKLLGDDTAERDGRLTLNPLKHIDPLGFLFIMLAGFGWAKPVAFNRANLKNPKRDEAIIALAGPFSNLVLALAFAIVLRLCVFAAPFIPAVAVGVLNVIFTLLYFCVYINLGLFVFNLVPLPPLDGSHLIFSAFDFKPQTEAMLYRFGSYALFGLIIFESWSKLDILPVGKLVSIIANGIFTLLGMPAG